MRWHKEVFPPEGSERKITEFLLYPLSIQGETRWLERAIIIQRFYHNKPSGGGWGSDPQWCYERWDK